MLPEIKKISRDTSDIGETVNYTNIGNIDINQQTINGNTTIYNNNKRKARDTVDDLFNPLSKPSTPGNVPESASSSNSENEVVTANYSDINIQLPDINNRLIINGDDISFAFFKFQKFTMDKLRMEKLYWDTHLHHILSLSSIFLITPGRMHQDIRHTIGDDVLTSFINHLALNFDKDAYEFSLELTNKIMKIVKMVDKKKLNRDDAVIQLLLLKSEATPLEFKIIKSIKTMIETLPSEVLNEEPHELELLSRYLNACLLPLFDDPEAGILFRWSDSTNLEASKTTVSISKRRPDSTIVTLDGYCFDYNRGFGEVKSKYHYEKHDNLSKDLARVGVFSKNAIDISNMNGVLGFQAVGRSVTFFISKLVADGIYVMYELNNFTVPGSIKQIYSLFGYLDEIYYILNIFETHCNKMLSQDIDANKNKKRQTLSTPQFNRIVHTSSSNKRPCITKHSV
ncbi:unnamed protein product [Cunninghamella echinulata]